MPNKKEKEKEKYGNGQELSDIEKRTDRGSWSNQLDFLFSCISLSVGLGNVWRFPYLCYENGGGAFLITYGIAMIFCGIPMFYQEVAVGQYLGIGGSTLVGQFCPLLQGVGYATMTIVFLLDMYYCVIICWAIFYLISSFAWLPELPWSNCNNEWNTQSCFQPGMNLTAILNLTDHSASPIEEFWEQRVLGKTEGITEFGSIRWELLCCLFLGWLLVYLVICKGLNQSGKVIWLTATVPYFILTVLLIRSVTLPGAGTGLMYYITPQWEKLLSPKPWIDGATQIFFAYSIGTGALPTLGSYNSFNHNCHRDAVITCIINTLTSLLAGVVTFAVLGHLSLVQNTTVDKVVSTGPGLVFLTYPEVVLQLPGAPIWAAMFFIMLIILGIDSEFCLVEAFIVGMTDRWPDTLRPHRKKFILAVCVSLFLLGIPMVSNGGFYIFKLMDYYSASGISLLWVCFFQTVAISWVFGASKLNECISQMLGRNINVMLHFCWVYFAPGVMLAIFIFYVVDFVPVTSGNYVYPGWAQGLGLCISAMSMLWVPGYMVYFLIVTPGSLKTKLKIGLTPKVKVKPLKEGKMPMSESSAVLLDKNNSYSESV